MNTKLNKKKKVIARISKIDHMGIISKEQKRDLGMQVSMPCRCGGRGKH